MISAALAALLFAATPASSIAPSLHLSVGTGYCARATVPATEARSPNPCLLVFGVAATLRHRMLEAGLSYEGRQPVDVLTLFAFQPPTVTLAGGSLGLVGTSGDRWRLSAAGEMGWRRYSHFAGHGPDAWRGNADAVYAGLVGRAATGFKNPDGRTDRFEVTVAWRQDLHAATTDVAGQSWRVGGWSLTMGVGLVSDW